MKYYDIQKLVDEISDKLDAKKKEEDAIRESFKEVRKLYRNLIKAGFTVREAMLFMAFLMHTNNYLNEKNIGDKNGQ